MPDPVTCTVLDQMLAMAPAPAADATLHLFVCREHPDDGCDVAYEGQGLLQLWCHTCGVLLLTVRIAP